MSEPPTTPSAPEFEPTYGNFRRFILPGLFVLGLFALLLARRPNQKPDKIKQWTAYGRIFGTTYVVKALTKKRLGVTLKELQKQIQSTLVKVDMAMSTYKKKSELSRLNRFKSTKPFQVSDDFLRVALEAKRVTKLTAGAFDVTIGPIVNLWGFGPAKYLKQPTAEQIKIAKAQVGSDKWVIDREKKTIQKKLPDLYIDLSAIAKGYGVDQVGRLLERVGFSDYMVEIGGEVRVRGNNSDGVAWRIGIEKPRDGLQEIQLVVSMKNASMATSGNYRNYLMVSGKRVSHLIDARSARPVGHALASVTVIHKSCMTADSLATALYVLGDVEGFRLAEQQKLAVLFMIPKGKGFIRKATSAFQKILGKSVEKAIKP